MECFKTELFPETEIFVGLFTNISNSSALKAVLKDLQCSFLDPRLVLSNDHLILAVTRALQARKMGVSKTNSLFLDVVYYLSATSNIKETLTRYGISEKSEEIILLAFDSQVFDEVQGQIRGNFVSWDERKNIIDVKKIAQGFKLSEKSQNFHELVLTRVAIKDI